MPFTNQTIQNGPYAADGLTRLYPFNFLALSEQEVRVYVTTPQGVETDINGWTVDGIGIPQGGRIIFTNPPNYPGQLLYVQARPKFSQEADFENQEAFNPSDINRVIDRAAQRDIYLRDQILNLKTRVDILNPGAGTGGQIALNWSQITGKPTGFPPSPHLHAMSDIVGLTESFNAYAQKDLENVSNQAFQNAATRAGIGTGGGGGNGSSGVGGPPSLASFGAINGDGVTSGTNDAAFIAAEASSYPQIYLPPGEYKTSREAKDLTKNYVGPGYIIPADGSYRPSGGWLRDKPAYWPTQGQTGFFRGANKFGKPAEWWTIGENSRKDLNTFYFEAEATPHVAWLDINDGSAGFHSRTAASAGAGSTSIQLWADASQDWAAGQTFKFASERDAPIGQTYTVSSVSGATLNFTPALDTTYPAGTIITKSKKTMSMYSYIFIRANTKGGGDIYGSVVRMQTNFKKEAGQKHWSDTHTCGQYGGDIWCGPTAGGSYHTGWESQYHDSLTDSAADAADVGIVAQIDSFMRFNDTGAYGCMWLGTLLQSGGTKPADAAHVVSGKWRTALDTVAADLTTFLSPNDNRNIAINMAIGHRLCLNSKRIAGSRTADPTGYRYGPMYGSTPGDMYIGSGADGLGDFIEMRYDRPAPNNAQLRLRQNSVNTNVNLNANARVSVGDSLYLGMNGLPAGGQIGLFFGPSGNYITFNSSANRFEFYKNYALVSTI